MNQASVALVRIVIDGFTMYSSEVIQDRPCPWHTCAPWRHVQAPAEMLHG